MKYLKLAFSGKVRELAAYLENAANNEKHCKVVTYSRKNKKSIVIITQ
ncbi:hypothetical protein SAMN05661008_01499 [Alkalithermobacter thermoalcaliphilus JW-YL-7 = DSM 7308]|uniref:Uncharacterized protein n=2 Tax=Clostridium paradoxum TaxID=29346 RepID=A0A150FQZ9_CLOPD|nr:hypothetical protein JWYL7_1116 [[Clostridium] paradoxum JW-YL-7 = DSM 7308]SHL12635.1 hypothetical protein SAMN05661008_01499 [[Clostridium] paradoxum JW-YL-7 = DSM 7308]